MPRKKILYGYQPESTCVSAWLFVIFPFQSCPTRETAVDAAIPVAVPAPAGRCQDEDIAGLFAVDAACPLAVGAENPLVFRCRFFRHPGHSVLFASPEVTFPSGARHPCLPARPSPRTVRAHPGGVFAVASILPCAVPVLLGQRGDPASGHGGRLRSGHPP